MKKITLLFILLTTYIFSNINVIVSILPQKRFVQSIGGDKVNVSLMVLPGNSPHTYEPKPSQMKKIAEAELYFTIGVEFENVWLAKFKNLNPEMKVVNLTKGVEKTIISRCHHEDHNHNEHHTENKDPHIWTAPQNVKIIAQNIYQALAKADPVNKHYYQTNLNAFMLHIEETDTKIKEILSSTPKGSHFMVFHPSWGYFAQAYHLTQLAVEVEGKAPKPKELIMLMKEAREEKVTAIFTQPEFSDASAKIIAKELGIPVVKVSPLAQNWAENLINIAKAIAGKK